MPEPLTLTANLMVKLAVKAGGAGADCLPINRLPGSLTIEWE